MDSHQEYVLPALWVAQPRPPCYPEVPHLSPAVADILWVKGNTYAIHQDENYGKPNLKSDSFRMKSISFQEIQRNST